VGEGQVNYVGEKAYLLRPGTDGGEECPGVEECGIVGVILDGDKVKSGGVGYLRQGERKLCVFDSGVDADAEEGWVVY
jgi:hypothetical protein